MLTPEESKSIADTILSMQGKFGAGLETGMDLPGRQTLTKQEFLEQRAKQMGLIETGRSISDGAMKTTYGIPEVTSTEEETLDTKRNLIKVDEPMSELIKKMSGKDIPTDSYITIGAYTDALTGRSKQKTPAELKFEAEQKEKELIKQKHTEMVKTSAEDTLKTISEIEKGVKNFGIKGQLLPKEVMPGTAYYNWKTNLEKLLSTTIVNLMTTMKNASKTGATGFGQLSNKELGVLQSAATALKAGLSPEDAQRYLNDMKEMSNKILQKNEQTRQSEQSRPDPLGLE